jgi:site-specific recombinase XerD
MRCRLAENVANGVVTEKKTGKIKKFQLSPNTKNILKRWQGTQKSGLLFPQKKNINAPINRSTYYRALKNNESGRGAKMSAHSFRKLYAQNKWFKTHDLLHVQYAMNHKYITTTARYLDIDIEKLISESLK